MKRLSKLPVIYIVFICILLFEKTNSFGQQFLDTASFSSVVKPGDNFFLYADGKWFDTVRIPSTETSTGSFSDLAKKSRAKLKYILDSVADGKQTPGSIEQKTGDFYASGIDTATIEKRGYDPVKPYFKQIDLIENTAGIMQFVTAMQKQGDPVLFNFYIGSDEKNSAVNIAAFSQGGIGLPDRDYYFKNDPSTQAVVNAYKNYIQTLFTLTGDDSVSAAQKTSLVYELEKDIAASHRTNIELRDPQSNYHKLLVADINKQMSAFDWDATLNELGLHVDSINLQQPNFYSKIDTLLKTVPLSTWKAYLRFHVLSSYAFLLSSDFINAQFAYAKILTGQSKIKPRWERMVITTDNYLGEALGQLYVKKYFPEDSKKRMLELVNNLQKAFAARIDKLDWMSDSTKIKAKEKLSVFIKKIGYPDKWRDYSKVIIDRNKFFENVISCDENEYQYRLSKVGKPVDKTEWGMTPPTINAYYNPSFNEIVFPAGILQPPFFDPNADDAINYGAIGVVIGHEMTHGFDDQGAQYDKHGILSNWWSKTDSTKFAAKTQSVANLYSTFTVLDTVHIKGGLTNGENIADMGGVAISYDAFKMTKQGHDTTKIDGLTPDQRFFLSYTQIWKIKRKDAIVRMLINTNPHSPEMWRVNGPLMNFKPFYLAFNIQPGEKMYRSDDVRIKIW